MFSLLLCAVYLLCTEGKTWTEVVQQTPGLLVQVGQSARMDCSQNVHGTYLYMDWFQQLPGEDMRVIVHTVPYKGPVFAPYTNTSKYSVTKPESWHGTFTVKTVEPSDSGVYFCAVGFHSDANTCHKLHKTTRLDDTASWSPGEVNKQMRDMYDQMCCCGLDQLYVFGVLVLTEDHQRATAALKVWCGQDRVKTEMDDVMEGNVPLFFGNGTKLTVLDNIQMSSRENTTGKALDNSTAESNRAITPPRVKVLGPSENECQNHQRDKRNKKTLLCVASGFYPDQVTVSWQVDGSDVTEGVATDGAAVRRGEYYSITSRLRVPLSQWFTADKNFTCSVSFFNGIQTVYRSDWVKGIEGPGSEALREKYLRITRTAELLYIILIVKSSIFGVLVVFLVYRLQDSSGKQRD